MTERPWWESSPPQVGQRLCVKEPIAYGCKETEL
jgi:hypothetical protein